MLHPTHIPNLQLIYVMCLWVCLFRILSMNGIVGHVVFYVLLTLLTINVFQV
jgi:spore maturation protein SpmA